MAPAGAPPGFGKSVAVSGDGRVAAVGAQSSASDEEVPAVYVFVHSGSSWKVAQSVRAGSTEDSFGRSVAVSGNGNTIVVGDPKEPPNGTGVAQVFVRSGSLWKEAAEVEAESGDSTFGDTVAVSSDGKTMLVLSFGAGYVFARSGQEWKRVTSLVPPTGGYFSLSGAALSPDGRSAVLTDDDVKGDVAGPGEAYVFVRTGTRWTRAQTIIEPGAPRGWHEFGAGLALTRGGRTLLIGAPLTPAREPTTRGAIRVFTRVRATRWQLTQTLSSPAQLSSFGESVAVTPDGSRIVAGSPVFAISR